ncbi:MAG: hypothetical protein HYY20_12815 [Candidatus Tectomicrobia bacterium]|uniref:RidA family protein n=1 Tax=Tectimicrobiota bacterium TaxID=2528274 RepID=A0A932FXW1_UNCTE|nr:hypothetical protein [Candidatus Tectomicrobia bacterium]
MARKRLIDPGWSWDDTYTFSQGVRSGDLLFVAGQGAFDPSGNLVGRGDIAAQTRQIFENMKAILGAEGALLNDVVNLKVFLGSADYVEPVHQVRAEYFKGERPSSSGVEAGDLVLEGMLIEIDAVAALGAARANRATLDPGWSWDDRFIFSQGVAAGDLIFVSGQLPLDAQGNLVGRGDSAAQARQVFSNMRAVLEQAGAGMDDVVMITSFFADIGNLSGIHQVRREFFREPFPASTGVEVRRLPFEGMLLEVDAIAVRGGLKKEVVDPGWAWDDQFAFSQAIRAGDLLFVSGQVALDPAGKVVGQEGDMAAQTRQVFENLQAILGAAGASLDDVVKLHSYLPDVSRYGAGHEVRARYLTRDYPASRGVGVKALAFPGLLLEVDVIAALGK